MVRHAWREKVREPDGIKVFEALENPKWPMRTLEGLAKEARLPEERVRDLLAAHKDIVDSVERSGQRYFTLDQSKVKGDDFWTQLRTSVSKEWS